MNCPIIIVEDVSIHRQSVSLIFDQRNARTEIYEPCFNVSFVLTHEQNVNAGDRMNGIACGLDPLKNVLPLNFIHFIQSIQDSNDQPRLA